MAYETPVLLLIFNRLETTKQVFQQIKIVKPKKLFIVGDGPREGVLGEKEKCEILRKWVINAIDWDCEIKTLFSDINHGCGRCVSDGISWFFEQVEEGVVLEDDCIPDVSFFNFCSNLLEYYKEDSRVMHIGGTNLMNKKLPSKEDYYFSQITHIWGWATWRRAWKLYDYHIKDNHEMINIVLSKRYSDKFILNFWKNIYQDIEKIEPGTWDYQWQYTILKFNGIAIVPCMNLISNVGFGVNATHTFDSGSLLANLKTFSITISNHPTKIIVQKKNDNYILMNYYLNHKRTFFTYILIFKNLHLLFYKLVNKILKSFI